MTKINYTNNYIPSIYTMLYILSIGIPTLIIAIYAPILFQTFNFDNIEIGYLLSLVSLSPFFIPFLFLKLKIGTKSILLCLFFYILSLLSLFYTINDIVYLSINLIIFSFTQGVIFSYLDGLVIDEYKEKYGKMRGTGSIAFASLSFILGSYYSIDIIVYMILTYIILFTLMFSYILLFVSHHDKHTSTKVYFIDILNEKRLWVVIFLGNLAMGAFYSFFGIFLLEKGYTIQDLSYLWTLSVIAEIIFMFKQESIGEKISAITLIKLSFIISTIRFLIIVFCYENIYLLYLAQVLHFASFGMLNYGVMKYLSDKYQHKIQSKIQIYRSSMALGLSFGSFMGGFIFGYYFFYILAFIFFFAYIIFFSKKEVIS